MNKMKKILALLLAVATVFSVCAGLAGCKKDSETDANASGEAGTYTATVKTATVWF